jgi:hypothetical protein
MLSDVMWLVAVWVIWTAIGVITFTLVRWAMRDQQQVASDLEAQINAARLAATNEDAERARWAVNTGAMPPLSAT